MMLGHHGVEVSEINTCKRRTLESVQHLEGDAMTNSKLSHEQRQ